MAGNEPTIVRNLRYAIVLLLMILIVCTAVAWKMPANAEWIGINIPNTILLFGIGSGMAACLCAIIWVKLRL
jgi:hypothetical protein